MNIEDIKNKIKVSKDYIFKELKIDRSLVYLLFNEVLTDSTSINRFILEELINFSKYELKRLCNFLPNTNIKVISDDEIFEYVNNGYLVIITKWDIYATEFKAKLDRGVDSVSSELSINGPKDGFSENFNTNLGLIRRRIKSVDLKSMSLNIGRSSNTKVGILYMDNIVKKDLVKKIYKLIKSIDIDGIIDSSYIKRSIDSKNTLFPTVISTERPDKTSMALLEGKVVIICDMSPYALILPSFFIDFFHTVDDYYQKDLNATFIRIIRVFAFIIAVFTPAIYISVTTRNYDLVPLPLLLMLKAGRTFVPFPAYLEALFMIVCFEILKETDLRMSATTGSAVSILGGLILGDAAVSAGIVSPIMIIVIAISSIAGLIYSSVELGNALRFYKIILLLLSAFLGIYGVILGTSYLIYKLVTIKVFGLPYFSPFIPYENSEIDDSIIKTSKSIYKRNALLTNNLTKGRKK